MITKDDRVLDEILKTENEMTKRSMDLLRSRYDKEKELWNNEKNKTETELNSLKNQLLAAENRLKKIQNDYSEEKTENIENLKLSLEELKAQKEREREKWDSVEQRVKFYRQVLEETQSKLADERTKYENLQKLHINEEHALRDAVNVRESEILQLRNELAERSQEWIKEKTKLESEIAQIKEKFLKEADLLKNDADEYRKTIEKKDAALSAISNALQETTIKLAENQNNLRQMQTDMDLKQARIMELDKKYNESIKLVGEERNKWRQTWEDELKNWQSYINDSREREKILKLETEDRLKKINSIISSLESQLAIERENLRLSAEKNTVLEDKLRILSEQNENEKRQRVRERQEFEAIIEIKGKEAELSKQQVIDQYGKIIALKDREISNLQNEISQLNANLAEEQRLFQLEKQENRNLSSRLEQSEDDKRNLLKQMEQERASLKKMLLDEQINFESRLAEQSKMTDIIKKQREEEAKHLQDEFVSINEQFSELRNIYQGVKIENEQRKARVGELETEVQKLIEQLEKQRKEWENLLIGEQQNWEQRRNEILSREELIVKSREDEIKRLETAIDELTAKLIAAENLLHSKEILK